MKQERLDHDIVISGVVKVEIENLINIANKVINVLKLDSSVTAIKEVSRINIISSDSSMPPPIIVTFNRKEDRDKVLFNKRGFIFESTMIDDTFLKRPVYINENLIQSCSRKQEI